ncbi:MFS general substrate transporter [Bimuria novae-zelandiae CBS 107.79]|uniref:MFS general substrate transporter n=1 Tax=Bimuria novae-zelandiae CBS 107.79 TaxID=1447943 RepID=A0A6A5UH95_9PLEO|nr:MFS general substrate transporter [Bimuria novae-zelandiae CBS 107.79]
MNGHHSASERTPLLRPNSSDRQHETAVYEDDIQDAQTTQGALTAPQFPELGKQRSYSSSHWLAPDQEPASEQPDEPGQFGEDGLLAGLSRKKFRCIIGGVFMGYFIAMFDSTLMASSHPVITSYFNASNSASWLSTAFLLTSTSLQPLFGRLSDTFGRRSMYLSGLLFLTATTGWCALAQSIGSFIAARAFCGIGAAAVLSMGSIIINDLVSIQVRSTYQAYINIFYGGGSTLGAACGGFLCDKLGWRMTFAIQIPFLVAIFIDAYFTTPSTLGPNLAQRSGQGFRDALRGFDIAGSVLLTGSVAFLIAGLNLGGNVFPWKHPIIIISLVVAVVAGTILLIVERRAAKPVMPLYLLFSRPRGSLVFNNFLANIGINAIIFNAPLYFQAVKLESASSSGFRLAGPSLALMICGVSSGFIMAATGRMTWLIVLGSLSMLLGAVLLSVIWDGIPTWLATLFLVPPSLGQGLSFPASMVGVLATSTQDDQAVMTSTLTLWRQLGTVMGVALSSLVLQNALTAYLNALVTGKHKEDIILTVRRSVRSILTLDPKHQHQVIDAYARSLRVTFISAIAVFVVVNVLTFIIRLPNLRPKKVEDGPGSESRDERS